LQLIPKAIGRKGLGYILVLPCLAITGILIFYPIVNAVYLSLTDYSPLEKSISFIGLENYWNALFSDIYFWQVLRNTIIYVGLLNIFHFTIGLGIALLLNEQIKGRNLLRGIIIIPWIIPSIAAFLAWRMMYASTEMGLLNWGLMSIGLISGPVDWLGNPDMALYSVIAAGIWKGVPFNAVMLLAGLQSIPLDLYAAAKVDGASALQAFRYVTLPSLRECILVVVLFNAIWCFTYFDLVFILTRGGPIFSTHTLATYTYLNAFESFKIGYGSAIGNLLLLVVGIFAILFIRAVGRE